LPGDGVQVLAVVHVNLQVGHGIGVLLTEGFQFLGILRIKEGLQRGGPVASTHTIASRESRVREVLLGFSLSRSLAIFVPVIAVESSHIVVVLPGDGVQVLAVVHVNLQVGHSIGVLLTEDFQFLGVLRIKEGLHRRGPVASTHTRVSRESRDSLGFGLSRSLAIAVSMVAAPHVTGVHGPVVTLGVSILIGAIKSFSFSSCEDSKADQDGNLDHCSSIASN